MLVGVDELCVLLVDDEPKVINGLERSLSLLEEDWDILVAYSGEEALAILDEEKVQVVLSDLRMPVMDGAAFLSKTRKEYPGTVRFILSGYADKDLMLNASQYAHRYLVKPSSAQDVVNAIREVWKTHAEINNEEVVDKVSNAGGLLSGKGAIGELLKTTDDPECTIERLKELVVKYPPVYASVLRVSNTAFFGSGGCVESIDQALMILGMDFVKALALIELTKSSLALSPAGDRFADQMFEHSVEASQLVRRLKDVITDAKLIQRIQSIALLHDLGKLILLDYAGDRYIQLCEESLHSKTECWRMEREEFGCDHAMIGAYLFNLWGFPIEVVQGIAWHHDPESIEGELLCPARVMNLLNLMSHDVFNKCTYFSGSVSEALLDTYSLPKDLVDQIKDDFL